MARSWSARWLGSLGCRVVRSVSSWGSPMRSGSARTGSLRVGRLDDSLLTEARVVAQLPAAVGYPRLIGAGRTGGRCWMVTERLAGQNLESAWPRLTAPARVCAVRDFWTRVNAVHDTDLEQLPTLDGTPLNALLLQQPMSKLSWRARQSGAAPPTG